MRGHGPSNKNLLIPLSQRPSSPPPPPYPLAPSKTGEQRGFPLRRAFYLPPPCSSGSRLGRGGVRRGGL